MVKKSELETMYSTKTTAELLSIIKSDSYTTLAIETAIKEIKLRGGISTNDAKEYYSNKIVQEDELFRRANFIELSLIEKIVIYFCSPLLVFLWIFSLFFIIDYLQKEGFYIKLKQSLLFFTMSIFGLFCSIYLIDVLNNNFLILCWLFFFVVAYIFDQKKGIKRKKEFEKIYRGK